jgi:Tfp pilus assembly protein PilX
MIQKNNKKNNSGFALLVAIITTGILMLIAFVVVNVALKQLIISNAYQSSQYAFYMADSGVECAMYWDLKNGAVSAFDISTPGSVTCNNQTVTTGSQTVQTSPTQSSRIGGGGASSPVSIFQINFGNSCAIVLVTKNANGTTEIDSHGYNTCNASAGRRYERGITTTY